MSELIEAAGFSTAPDANGFRVGLQAVRRAAAEVGRGPASISRARTAEAA